MFLRRTDGHWMTTMPEYLNMDWIDSVKHVFGYFTERTPRSYFKQRETSFIWNYKYADAEFGRVQARDMLQHLWSGPISNAAVDIVQGSRSVEVRSVGITKGAAIDRILAEIVDNESMATPIDYVLCIGHFLGKDEGVYAFFDPDYPPVSRTKAEGGGSSAGHSTSATSNDDWCQGSSSVLDLKGENYFSCTVGRERSNARYLLNSSEEVVSFLKELADSLQTSVADGAD